MMRSGARVLVTGAASGPGGALVEELILPDGAAGTAYASKLADRPAYDAVMRRQAAKLDQVAGP